MRSREFPWESTQRDEGRSWFGSVSQPGRNRALCRMRMESCRFHSIVLGALLLFAIAPIAQAQRFTAKFDRSSISLGESTALILTFEGVDPQGPPSIPSQPNLQIEYQSNQSQIRIFNGRRTETLSFIYAVTPNRLGDYAIPPLEIVLDNKKLKTQPLNLKVTKPPVGAVNADGSPRPAFLRINLPKTKVYVGEVFPVEIQLFYTGGQDLQVPQLDSDGFVLGKSAQPQQTRTRANNVIYNLVTFSMSASAARTGKLNFGPAHCKLTLHIPQKERDFFGPIVVRQPVTLATEPIEIEVLPLPSQNVPADFSGTVGDFTMTASASPTNVMVGDPITLKMQLSGKGSLDALTLPQRDWRDFRAYPATSTIQPTDALGITGTKAFEQVVIPQNADIKEVPSISFSYFDPEKQSYRTLRHPAIALSVRPSNAAQPQPTVLATSPNAAESSPTRDIVHIKPYLGMVGEWQQPLARQTWFLGLQGLPIMALITVVLWRKRQEMLANDPRLRRRRRVEQLVRANLKELRQHAEANDTEAFFATLFRLLQEQIGERLDLPASAITEAILEEQLSGRNVSPELLSTLHDLFQACNQARYAPERMAHELIAMVPNVESAVQQLQELPDEK
jgi:hypothetical protein